MAERPKVGPADAETRRKKLRQVLDGEQKPKPKSLRDAVDAGVDAGTEKPKKKQLKRRFGTEGKTEDELGA